MVNSKLQILIAWTRGHSLSFNTSHWPILSISHLRDKIIHVTLYLLSLLCLFLFYFIFINKLNYKCNNNQRDCDVFIPPGCHLYFLFRNPHVPTCTPYNLYSVIQSFHSLSYYIYNILQTFYIFANTWNNMVHDFIADQHEDWFHMQYTTSCDLGGFRQIPCIGITIHLREKW